MTAFTIRSTVLRVLPRARSGAYVYVPEGCADTLLRHSRAVYCYTLPRSHLRWLDLFYFWLPTRGLHVNLHTVTHTFGCCYGRFYAYTFCFTTDIRSATAFVTALRCTLVGSATFTVCYTRTFTHSLYVTGWIRVTFPLCVALLLLVTVWITFTLRTFTFTRLRLRSVYAFTHTRTFYLSLVTRGSTVAISRRLRFTVCGRCSFSPSVEPDSFYVIWKKERRKKEEEEKKRKEEGRRGRRGERRRRCSSSIDVRYRYDDYLVPYNSLIRSTYS